MFVFQTDTEHFCYIQQVVQRVGAVPELMLSPAAHGHGEEEELVDVRRAYGEEGRFADPEGDPLPGKKPSSVHRHASAVSLRHRGAMYSSSGSPQQS